MFDFRVVTQWVDATLHQYLPASLVTTTEFVLVGVCLLVAYAVMALGLIYAERKVCAFFQCRLGPNRVGPFGMIQTVTDMIKMLIKEIIEINHVERVGNDMWPGAFLKYNDEDNSELAFYMTDLKNLFETTFASWLTVGAPDNDSWEAYKQSANAAGYEEARAIVQKAVDAYFAYVGK